MNIVNSIWRSMRPRQWTKNAVVLAPLLFSQKAGDPLLLGKALAATAIFCLASSATYLVNDLLDREQDRSHPEKSLRPIIAGSLLPGQAMASAALLAGGAALLALGLNGRFTLLVIGYLALNLTYSTFLKKIVIIDVMTIAACFVIRVAGGAAAVEIGVSHWLFLCTVLLALFLGFGKRRHELILLENHASMHRAILSEYSPYFLDQMMSVVTASTVIAYSLYTISPEVAEKLGTPYLPFTIPFVLYGIFRYLYLIHQKEEGGSPSSILVNDKPLLANILLWALVVAGMLYLGSRG